MELQIIKDKTNPLLKRREVSLKIQNKGTPSRTEVKNKLAALANSKPELIVVEHLDTTFGNQEVLGAASIYETEERLKQLAHQHLVVRGVPKAAEEASKEAPAAPAKEAEVKAKAEETKKPEEKPKAEAKAEGTKKPEGK